MKEKDLGVTMNANMKVSEQFRIAASKGNQVQCMFKNKIDKYPYLANAGYTYNKCRLNLE